MSLSVITTINSGTQTITVRPAGVVTIGQVFTLNLFGVSVSFTATVATAANVVTGLLAAIAASADPEWSLVDSELDEAGDALLISYSSTAGTLKIWRGDAVPVAQVTRVTPSNVQTGDVLRLTINGKSISVSSTGSSASAIVAAFVAQINDSSIREFREIVASQSGDNLILTAAQAGVPVTVTADTTNGSVSGVSVTTVRNGAAAFAGSAASQTFRIPKAANTASVNGSMRFQQRPGSAVYSASVAVGASAATVEAALDAMPGAVAFTVSRTDDAEYWIYATTGGSLGFAEITVDGPLVETFRQGTSTVAEIQTILFPETLIGGGTQSYGLLIDGVSSASLNSRATAVDVQAALDAMGLDVTVTVPGNGVQLVVTWNSPGDRSLIYAIGWGSALTFSTQVYPSGMPAIPATPAYNEQQLISLTGGPTAGTFTLTFGGNTTSGLAHNVSAATVQTALRALASIGGSNVNVSGTAGGPWTVDFVGTLAATNVALIVGNGSSLTGGISEAFVATTTTSSAGPNHWDTPENWLPPGVPSDFDRVRFEFGDSDCLYGLAQSGVMLTELQISSTYSGSIGLPRSNPNGYLEYRVRDLTLHCPWILIGNGTGAGSGKIQLNTLTTTCYLEIRSSGGSREPGVPAVTWYGDNEASEITLKGGELGISIWSDQVAHFYKVEQHGGTLRIDRANFKLLYAPGQSPTAHDTRVERIEL